MKRKAIERKTDGPPDFCDYGVGILGERLDKMLAHTEGAASGNQTRPIHQMRVWSRRSRAALDVFGACFADIEPAAFADIVREVKTVTRALGAARDLDVMLETMRTRMESLPSEQQGGVDSFLDYLQAQRNDRQQAVTDSVKHLEKSNLKQQLQRLADKHGYHSVTIELPTPAEPKAEEPPVAEPLIVEPVTPEPAQLSRPEAATDKTKDGTT